jgi:hypothetical protein
MKLAKMLMTMTAATFLWGCGEGMPEPVQPNTQPVQEGDVAKVQNELAAGDPFIGYWTAGAGWNIRVYETGYGYYRNSPDPTCWPNNALGWYGITYQFTDASNGARHYYGQTALSGCYPNYNYYSAEFIIHADGRTMEERAYSANHYVIWKKVI